MQLVMEDEVRPLGGELGSDLEERGVDFTPPRRYVVDGAKALLKAVQQ